MKYFYLFAFSFLYLTGFAQSGITWSAAVPIAASSYSNYHPRIVTDAMGNPLIIWGNLAGYREYFSRWNGTAFTSPVALNPMTLPIFTDSWAGPDMASKGDTVYVAIKSSPEDTGHVYVVHSFNGGMTFSMPVRVDYINDSVSRFPALAIDDNGNPLVAYMKFNSMFLESRWVVNKSTDAGNTFGVDTKASGFSGGTICDCCPGALLNSGNTVAMLYRDNLNNIRNMWAGFSNNGGISFTNGIQMDPTNWFITSCPSSGPDGIIIGDSLYMVYMSGGSGTNRVYYNKASISNLQAESAQMLTGNLPGLLSQNYPRMANSGNAAAIAWKQSFSAGDQLGLFFTDNVHNGFPPLYDTLAMGDLVNVDVTITPGVVHVVWQDNNSGLVMYRKGTYTVATSVPPTLGNSSAINIFPNPAHNEITLEWKGNSEITSVELLDANGKIIIKTANFQNGKTTLSVSGFQSGIYVARLSDKQGNLLYKNLVVE